MGGAAQPLSLLRAPSEVLSPPKMGVEEFGVEQGQEKEGPGGYNGLGREDFGGGTNFGVQVASGALEEGFGEQWGGGARAEDFLGGLGHSPVLGCPP